MERKAESELFSRSDISVMLVAPGSLYSTFDTYSYYLDALRRNPKTAEKTSGFAYHNVLEYHRLAREAMYQVHGMVYGSELSDIVRSARELLIEVYADRPDVVMFIDGSKFPPVLLRELKRFIKTAKLNTVLACYLTEAPYINDPISGYDGVFDVVFTNDKYDYERRNQNGDKMVFYLPHSYSRDVHYPDDKPEPSMDMFFCGTIFPERARLFRNVNWEGIDAYITGTWSLTEDDTFDVLKKQGVAHNTLMKNEDVATAYQSAKVVVNLGRTFGWDKQLETVDVDANSIYSMGPRVVEAAACGAFIVSEYRPEIADVFGGAIPFFSSAGELEELLRYYVSNERERSAKAEKILESVQGMSYDDRVQNILIPAFEEALYIVTHRQ